jgi:hypothetical protein
MSKVIVDDELRAKLNGLSTDTVFCDPSGKTLGYLVSPDEFHRLKYALASSRRTDEEVDRLRQQTGGRSLAEIWKDLGAA